MGTDYLQLLDRRTAELVVGGSAADLATLVEARTTLDGPPVWRNYWDAKNQIVADFARTTSATQRLRTIIESGSSLEEIKDDLIRQLCIGDSLYLDYWGCYAEVFSVQGPLGSITWEQFTAPMRNTSVSRVEPEEAESTGCFLLTNDNVESILLSLEAHRDELRVMDEFQIDRLREWRAFCGRHPGFCILYQIDF
ncbi:MAG TPA: hypothetical protein VEU96_14675 [Bryobacteraceae bacterium]|nr:hypothetical protein [Bryobacteraceae bacterium]